MNTVRFQKSEIMNIGGRDYLALELLGYPDKVNARKIVAADPRDYIAEIKQYRQKRSLDANAYYHVLIGKLAETLLIPTTEIYWQHIKEIGGNYEIVPIKECAVDMFADIWKSKGIGWLVDNLGSSKLDGYVNLKVYYGSSTYDTKQMARLIDFAVQDCKDQNIETMPPHELERLISDWEERERKH